ncbi:MAG: ROK family protein [Candidatus Nanoarchaeia archaeon]|nr:ROK family protein [Candidatus Nanoarchaeia archaeon]
MKKYLIGVDIGGNKIKAGLVSNGKVIKRFSVNTEPERGEKAVIEKMLKAVSRVFTNDVSGIGVGSPGPIDYKKGNIIGPKNIPLKNFNIKRILKKKFNVPVFLDNDANCFAFGEAVYGAGKKYDIVVGLTLGTGVGGGIVINKKIFHGRLNAGEFGHISIKHDGIKCKCGNFGCIEEYASERGIMRLAKGIKAENPLDIYELALKGNKEALEVFEKTGFYLGVAITNIIAAFDPEIIVVGGGISGSWNFFSKSMKETIKKRSFVNKNPIIVKSRRKDAAILGAASLVRI